MPAPLVSGAGPLCDNRAVNLLERIRRFWKPGPGYDHPLTERERDEDRPATTYDELSRTAEELVQRDFDPDDPGRGPRH